MSRIDTQPGSPHYTWERGYHINGQGSATHLEETILPDLGKLPIRSLVADFGCGNGRLLNKAPHFTQRPYYFRAFDAVSAAVAHYNATVNLNNGGRRLVHPDRADRAAVADLTQLDPGTNRFDSAFLWRVLHSIPHLLPQFGEEDVHVRVLRNTSQSLKPGALYHVAARSDRDWVAEELRRGGLYVPGQTNNCYEPMKEALDDQPGVQTWNLYFFGEGELAKKGKEAGLEIAYELDIEEESGFPELRRRGPLSYDYVAFYKPT